MAAVTINIPNIGNVIAENAASEETLQKILTALQKSSKGNGPGSKEYKEAKKAVEDSTEAIKKDTKAQEENLKKSKETSKSSEAVGKYFKNLGNGIQTGSVQAIGALAGFGKSLVLTAASVAASFATSYDEMANNPIQAASTMLATNIDLAGMAMKAAVDVAGGMGKAAAGLLGPWSGAGNGLVDALSTAAKAAIDFATTVLKMANQVFAKEFQKSADALKSYTKAGASFAGGMIEMRDIAHSSGMGMDTFNKAVIGSSEELRNMGLTQAEGARAIANGMKAVSTTVGKSGNTLRDEMLAMGFSYEEQGQIVAQLGAQMKASGIDIKNLAPSELARQTKDYATNLKVISDITGQDAKKLMEKARAESMRGALMGKLDANQQKAFKDAHTTLMTLGPEAGPKMQQALMQMLAGGTVTDPVIAANAEAMELIKKTAAGVQAGNQDMITETQSGTATFADQMRASGETATSTAALMSSTFSGVGKDMASFGDSIRASSNLTTDAATISKDAAIKQSEANDTMTTGYTKLTADMTTFQNEMELLATEHLPAYANLLRTNAEETMGLMKEGIKIATDGIKNYVDGKLGTNTANDGKLDAENARNEALFKGVSENVEHYAAVGIEKVGSGLGSAFKTLGAETIGGWLDSVVTKAKTDRVADETAYLKKEGRVSMASGGIATGPTSGFDATLHGTEAVIPLSDNRSIPVALDLSSVIASMQQGGTGLTSDAIAKFTDAIDKLSVALAKPAAGGGDTAMVALVSHLEELKDTAQKQLESHLDISKIMSEAKDVSERILNNSY